MRRAWLTFWLLLPLALGGASEALRAAAAAQPMAEWKGEFFDKKQGGLYLKLRLAGFPASQQTKYLTGNVQVTALNVLQNKLYYLSVAPGGDLGQPRQLWKGPSGKYQIKQLVMVDAAGVKRTWNDTSAVASERRDFAIKRQCLVNLGMWTVSPVGATGLKVTYEMVPNSYKEEGNKKDSSVAAVLNGFTGLIQEAIGGKKVLQASEDDHAGKNELRATITFTRQIAMFYKLDLFKHNNHAQAVANVLSVYDPNLRQCYTDRLDYNDSLRGDVKFTFLLSKQSGTMAKLRHSGGSVADPKLVECMYYQLAQIQFPVPENMIGELTYTYDVK